jgi:hypothetical protein
MLIKTLSIWAGGSMSIEKSVSLHRLARMDANLRRVIRAKTKEGAMKRTDTGTIVGIALAGAGVLFLLLNLGLLAPVAPAIWVLLFALGGGAFLTVFWRDRAAWWALIPGFVLLSIGALIGLSEFAPAFDDTWGGSLVLGGIGLSFWAVYLTSRARWWAIIPGGVLLTLAALAGMSTRLAGQDLGWVFFLGLALTFGLVYLLPGAERRNTWAIYPAAGLLAMALLTMASMGPVINLIWPLALIVAGLYLAYRTLRVQPR